MGGLTGLRVVTRLVMLAMLAASGVYVAVYLYRWEWNRALMAGVFFVAAEIALIGSATTSRIRGLERRLEASQRSHPVTAAEEAPDRGGTRPRRGPFAWLDEVGGGFNVFIPLLLGAGVILSLVAWAIERLARFVTAPVTGTPHISVLASLDLPTDGLVPPSGATDSRPTTLERPRPVRLHPVVASAVTFVALMGLLVGIWFLREAAESRPESGERGTSSLELEVSTRESGSTTAQIIDALWIACRLRLPPDATLVSSAVLAPGRGQLVVSPALGHTEHRKFEGCLEDAVIDRVSAEVTRFETTPARPR